MTRCCALVLTLLPATLAAQDPPASDPPPLLTLAGWADDAWFTLLDRDGSFHGRLSPTGTFQRFHEFMDDEYELDVWSGFFHSSEDARWHLAQSGFRAAGSSINHPFILNYADWRDNVHIAGPVDLALRYSRHHSLTAQRDYMQVGIGWRGTPEGGWAARAGIGMHFFKASADIELGIDRIWQRDDATWRLSVTAALLDAFNNLIFNALGVRPEEVDAHFNYRTLPVAGRIALVHVQPAIRAELHGGVSSRSRVHVTFPATGDPAFSLVEQVSFAGGLVEAWLLRSTRAAVYGTVATAHTDRMGDVPAEGDFGLTEIARTLGAVAEHRLGEAHVLEAAARIRWRPEQRTDGSVLMLHHRDRETLAQMAIAGEPGTGWRWRGAYQRLHRTAGVAAPWLTGSHHRLLTEGGYRFASRFELMGGVRWRLDHLTTSAFAGGHLRFMAVW